MKLSRFFDDTDRIRRGVGGALTAALGAGVLLSPAGERWSEQSHDQLFRLRGPIQDAGREVVIVDMDRESEQKLEQPSVQAWDRKLHATLLRTLKDLDVRVVAFDVLFEQVGTNLSAADEDLLDAASDPRRSVFGAKYEEIRSPTGQRIGVDVLRPYKHRLLIDRAGLVEGTFEGNRIRRHVTPWREGNLEMPSLAWRVAELTMVDPPVNPAAERWINYYGPSGDGTSGDGIQHVSFYRVLSNTVPPSVTFSNKVVFVGARTTKGPTAGSGTDRFETPFGEITGVAVNATAYLNLRRGDWLRRWPRSAEALCLMLLGGVVGYVLCGWRPLRAVLSALVLGGVVLGSAGVLMASANFLFPWLIVVAAQLPLAFISCVVIQSARPRALPVPVGESLSSATTRADPRPDGLGAGAAPGPLGIAPSIPDHTMLRCIGRGAYGEVWLAQDAIGTFHAVKLVYRSSFASDAPFEREFRGMQKYTPLSRNHPGWVHVLHVGINQPQGYFFYIMEVADDETTGQEIRPDRYQPRNLARVIEKARLPLRECVAMGVELADALDYLHGQLLVHRDIKPSNVIFVHGSPKFADVGLVTEFRNRDRKVSMLGTEGYIAPEGPGTAAADLYSLGKLLYEMSTGRDRLAFPKVPESLVESGPNHVQERWQEILLKLCQENPSSRYQSASELREDLHVLKQSLG